jgi:hypothetical protein
MFILALATAASCVEPPAEAIERARAPLKAAQAVRLAGDLSRLVGGEIKPENLVLLPANRMSGVPPFSKALNDRTGNWVFAQVATPAKGLGFTAAVAAPSAWSQSISLGDVDAAIVVSDAAVKTCPTAVCFNGGCVQGLLPVPTSEDCPQLMCTSGAECSDTQTGVTCLVNRCNLGLCVSQEVHAESPGLCPPAECMTDFECGDGTKECTYKRCDEDECTAVTVTVNASEMCPVDQCSSDSICGGGGGGGNIFEDIGL